MYYMASRRYPVLTKGGASARPVDVRGSREPPGLERCRPTPQPTVTSGGPQAVCEEVTVAERYPGLIWRKSSRSGDTNCVEVASSGGMIFIRDSKDRHGPVLCFAQDRWHEFLFALSVRLPEPPPMADTPRQ
jgi:hypothetical protein